MNYHDADIYTLKTTLKETGGFMLQLCGYTYSAISCMTKIDCFNGSDPWGGGTQHMHIRGGKQWRGGSTLAGGHNQFWRPLENCDRCLLHNVPWLFKSG